MFLSVRQGFGNSTPLSPAEEKLTLFNQIFFPSTFFLDVCLPFFVHLIAAKLGGEKSVVMV